MSISPPPYDGWKGEYSYPQLDMESVITSLAKYERLVPSPDKATWNESWIISEQIISEQLRGINLSKFTVEESMRIMDGTKTCGWPMCHKYQTKQQFWDSDDFLPMYNVLNESLYNDLEPVKYVDTIFLKWEMRPIAKCGPGKARTVFCQDAVSALWGVQHGKAFDMALIANVQETIMGHTAIAVGMTPFSNNFDQMRNKFKGFVTYEVDGSGWDSTMFPEVLQRIAMIRCRAYGYDEKTTEAVKKYYRQVSSTMAVLPNGHVQLRTSGNPSGQAATTMDNSMWSIQTVVYGLKRYYPHININRAWFKKHVRLMVFGDDVIMGISEEIVRLHGFSIEIYQLIMKLELGIVYTCSPGGEVTTCRWLNFGWGQKFGKWLPTLDHVKIMNSLHLRKEIPNIRNTLERVIGIRTLAFGDDKLFNYIDSYCNWLISLEGDFGLRAGILTRGELYHLYTGYEVSIPRVKMTEEWIDEESDATKLVMLDSLNTQ